VVLVLASGACAAVEGLDAFESCPDGCDASLSVEAGPAPDAAGEGGPGPVIDSGGLADGAADESAPADAGVAEAGAEAGAGEAGGVVPDGGACVCVSAAAGGWTGYVRLLVSDGGPPACAAPYGTAQSQLKLAPAGAAAECACACAPPSSGPITCQVELGSGGLVCVGETMTPAPQGACVIPPGPMGATSGPNGDSYGPTMVPQPSGSCTPDGGMAQPLAPPTWTWASVCASATEGAQGVCGASYQVCVPPPDGQPGSASGVCIYQSGDVACPSGNYSQRFVASASIVDTRGCTCGCATPACPADGYIEGFTSINCSGPVAATFNASTACMPLDTANGSVSFKYVPSHGAWTGTCAVSGAGPAGGVSVDQSHATTFCCVP